MWYQFGSPTRYAEHMSEEKAAILRVEYVKQSIIGVVSVSGASDEDAAAMAQEGWRQEGKHWTYTIRKGLEKGREEQTARGVVSNLWDMAVVYGVTRWVGDQEVVELAPGPVAELMLSGMSGDGRNYRKG